MKKEKVIGRNTFVKQNIQNDLQPSIHEHSHQSNYLLRCFSDIQLTRSSQKLLYIIIFIMEKSMNKELTIKNKENKLKYRCLC